MTTVLTAAHGNDPGAHERDAEPGEPDQGAVLQRHQSPGAAADLPEGGAVDLAPADLRADAPLGAQDQLPDHRADHGAARAVAGDHRAGADLAQGERAGRDPDHLAAAGRPDQPGAGALDLRPGPLGRLHQRRRPALGQDLARLAELRRVLVAGRPLVDAAGRPRQPHAERPPRAGADQGRHRRPGQGQPVPQLPPHPGQGGRTPT